MPKKDGQDPIEKARKRLVKAQADLQEAQDTRARVKLDGEQAVDRARQQAAGNLARATVKVEERSRAVDEARRELERLRQEALHVEQPQGERGELQAVGDDRTGDSP